MKTTDQTIKKTLSNLSSETMNGDAKQLTRDLVDEALILLANEEEEKRLNEAVGALSYRVGNVLEIISPKLHTDLRILKLLKEVLEEWQIGLEFASKTLKNL